MSDRFSDEEDVDAASELFETDVSFDRAVALFQRVGADRYHKEWTCSCGSDSKGIFEIQFYRRPPTLADAVVFGRPHGLPTVLTRDGGRFWYAKDGGRREEWKSMQCGMDGPVVSK
jgi:hypothetical protein